MRGSLRPRAEHVWRRAWIAAAMIVASCAAPAVAGASAGFGPLSGSGGCLTAAGSRAEGEASGCASAAGLMSPKAIAVSPDGANVYVAGGIAGDTVAQSFGVVAILKRDPVTGAVSESGCLSSDGTDGRDGASGACVPMPSLLGADGVAVSPDGLSVFVTSSSSAAVIAFKRDPASGALTRIGCLQGTPRPGSPCPGANLFPGSGAVVSSADGSALFVAAPLQGSLSTLLAPAAGKAAAGSSTGTAAGTTTGAGTGSSNGVASIFGVPRTQFLANPCIAVNGLDGECAVGVATLGLRTLAPSADGKQLYAVATGSNAVDVFSPEGSGGLAESGCLKVEAPPGLCTNSKLMKSPTQLAPSPDGKNVYVTDSAETGGRLVALRRDPATGTLSDASCLDFAPAPRPEEHEQGEGHEEEAKEPPRPPGPCPGAAGLDSVRVVAVSGDGSAVYTIGEGVAAIFSRDPATGKLTEASCAVNEDTRCTSLPALHGISAAAMSPDGRQAYVIATTSNKLMVFGIGAGVTGMHASASRAGVARVRVACPSALRRPCRGRLRLIRAKASRARHGHHRARVRRVGLGESAAYTIAPGRQGLIGVPLSPSAQKLLLSRRRLRVIAFVRADPLAGGSGYGRRLVLVLR